MKGTIVREDSRLSKLRMPPKKSASEDRDMLDLGLEEGSPKEEALESDDEASAEGDDMDSRDPSAVKDMSELEAISDDELLAELKKRGLMSAMESKGSEEENYI